MSIKSYPEFLRRRQEIYKAKPMHYEPWHEYEEKFSRIDYALVLAVVIVSACWGWREYEHYNESLNRPAWSSCVVSKSELSK